jgi:predicted transposase YbfD/YdcC
MENKKTGEYFAEVETTSEYNGYFFSVSAAITIIILGTFCGLRNMQQIHQWASSGKIRSFLSENFGIENLVCYSWFTQVLGLIKPESFNACFTKWVMESVNGIEGKTLSFDGKTVRSTAKMKCYKNPLHIVSTQIAELGITFGQKAVDGKSNEIPAVRELMELLEITGCMVVADALNCQKETAKAIVEAKADYLLSVKANQPNLTGEIAQYVGDDSLRKAMNKARKKEKSRDRIETRTAYTTSEIDWLLDVHFGEDFCRVAEQRTQENLNIIRKIVLNSLRFYKNRNSIKSAFSHLMLDCMIDPERILHYCSFDNLQN